MQGEGIVALFIPITISLGAFLMVWGIRYLENKENMAMIEKGMEPQRRRLFSVALVCWQPTCTSGKTRPGRMKCKRYGFLGLKMSRSAIEPPGHFFFKFKCSEKRLKI
ncbi:MAG: hypothetical protein IPM98_19620 [Lewinellaceae bacterium]|nr:hypothetical protein [Lewinellaceae bacterium]